MKIGVTSLERLQELIALEGGTIAQALSDSAPKASGRLSAGYTSTISIEGGFIVSRVSAEPHHKWVVAGRGKNKKRPPLESIRQWLMDKGLSEKEAKRAAWPVATKIAREGIKGKPLLQDVLDKRKGFEEALQKIFGEEVRLIANDLFDSLFPKKTT